MRTKGSFDTISRPEFKDVFSNKELRVLALVIIPVIILLLRLALLSNDVSASNSANLREKIQDSSSVVTFCLDENDQWPVDRNQALETLQLAVELFNANKPADWGPIGIGIQDCDVDFTFVDSSDALQEICQSDPGSTSIACALTGTNQVYMGPSENFNACKPEEMVVLHEVGHVAGVPHPSYNTQETWYTFMNPNECYQQNDLSWQLEVVLE